MEVIEKVIENNFKNGNKKTQIVLTHTSRNLFDFMTAIKLRFGGKPIKLPHYLIGKDGKILQILDDDKNGKYLNTDKVNNKSIVICLENLGWLEKQPLKKYHINWIGTIYREKVFDRKWRNYFFWDKYTDSQMRSLSQLCGLLCDKHNIPKKSVKTQGFFENAIKFNGVVCKSNFSNIYTDINPSFNFRILFNHAK